MPWPWISQSRYLKYVGCPYQFKRMEIDEYNPEKSKRTAEQGTVLHDFFFMFFDNVDFDYAWNIGFDRRKLISYFVTVLRNMVNVEKITDPHFKRNFYAFSMFEADHLIHLRTELDKKTEVRAQWMVPVSRREVFLTQDEFMMYGTLDRLMQEGDVRIIMDYKTGTSVPKAVRDEANSTDPTVRGRRFTKATISKFTTQATFYAIMDAYRNGFHFQYDELDEKGEPKWEFYRGNTKLSIGNYYHYIFLWTGWGGGPGPTYYMAYKRVHIRSVRIILNRLPRIRAEQDWKRKPNLKRCSWCPLYMKECKDFIEKFKIFNGDGHFELY